MGCVDITSALTVTVFVLFSLIFFTHCRPTLQLCIGVSARKLQIIIPLEILQIVILLLFICCYLYLNKIEFKGYTTHISLNSIRKATRLDFIAILHVSQWMRISEFIALIKIHVLVGPNSCLEGALGHLRCPK